MIVIDDVDLRSAIASGGDSLSSLLGSELSSARDGNEMTGRGNILIFSEGMKKWSRQSRRFKKMSTDRNIAVPPLQHEEAIKLVQILLQLPAKTSEQKVGLNSLIRFTGCNPRFIKETAS
jgi:hypothetical protein